jgi:hypothetical protein
VGQHRLQEAEGRGGVVSEKNLWPHHGLAGFNEGGKVEYAVEGLAMCFSRDEKVFKRGPVSQLTLNKFHRRREKIASSVTQIIERHCPMSCFDKQFRNGNTNVPSAAGYQYLHK